MCQLAVSVSLASAVHMCLPVCCKSVESENILLVLASVVQKVVYMEMIPQLLLVWMAFILYCFEDPAVQRSIHFFFLHVINHY